MTVRFFPSLILLLALAVPHTRATGQQITTLLVRKSDISDLQAKRLHCWPEFRQQSASETSGSSAGGVRGAVIGAIVGAGVGFLYTSVCDSAEPTGCRRRVIIGGTIIGTVAGYALGRVLDNSGNGTSDTSRHSPSHRKGFSFD